MESQEIGMLAVGNNELGEPIGKCATCPNCGKCHKVQYGNKVERDGTLTPSKLLGYVKCTNDNSYLVAIDGKGFGG